MERSLLLSCTCPDHLKHKIPCKHLYLVERIFDVFEVKHTPDPDPEDNVVENDQDDFAVGNSPPITESIPINVQLLLRAQRAQEQELRRRKREEEVAEAFADCETKLKELWIKMGNHIMRDGGGRKCTLDYMLSSVATLESAYRDVKGVNEIGARRKYQ
ncbi:hypothetical protein BGZ75_009025 [Mortierella antarctica]|nr:hypothetical protein BGZ75_009025 [Mortierella antarctica]